MHGDCCKYYIKMGMRYGVFNDGFILGREREEEKVYRDYYPSIHLVRWMPPPPTGLPVRRIGNSSKNSLPRRTSERPWSGVLRIGYDFYGSVVNWINSWLYLMSRIFSIRLIWKKTYLASAREKDEEWYQRFFIITEISSRSACKSSSCSTSIWRMPRTML